MSLSQEKLKEGLHTYSRPRTPDEINLTLVVRNILVESNVSEQALSAYDNNRFIIESADKNSECQRFFQNRFWDLQLISSDKPTVDERYCLLGDGEIHDWIILFKSTVLPFILNNNLPKVV